MELFFFQTITNPLFYNKKTQGVFFPALHNVVSKWAPPDEKGKFVAALLGGNLGTVFTFQLTGVVTDVYGKIETRKKINVSMSEID